MIVDVPGAFHSYLSGTGVVAGQGYSMNDEIERGAQELKRAYDESHEIRRGRGYSLRLDLPSVEAACVLAEYAETLIACNYGGDMDHSEVRAARVVLERIEHATAGRVRYDGFGVLLDEKRQT